MLVDVDSCNVRKHTGGTPRSSFLRIPIAKHKHYHHYSSINAPSEVSYCRTCEHHATCPVPFIDWSKLVLNQALRGNILLPPPSIWTAREALRGSRTRPPRPYRSVPSNFSAKLSTVKKKRCRRPPSASPISKNSMNTKAESGGSSSRIANGTG